MDTITIIATVLGCWWIFALCNLNILMLFHGFDNNITKQRYMHELYLSDKLYNTYDSICGYKFCNSFNWKWASLVIFCPVFNIIWLCITLYNLYMLNRKY